MNRGDGSFQRTRATLDRCDQMFASEALSAECIKLRSNNIMELSSERMDPDVTKSHCITFFSLERSRLTSKARLECQNHEVDSSDKTLYKNTVRPARDVLE